MIKKFKKIKIVGNFKDFSASGDITLGKANIIYGENDAGKSTLTSIIRSLILGKPELILERKTFGVNDEQYVELLFENNQLYRFQNGTWNNWNDRLRNIAIFDDLFINENIFTGMDISSEHQRGLYEFAIGEEGVTLTNEIERIKKDLRSSKYPELRKLESQINVLIGKHYELEEFVGLLEDREINKKIEEKKKELSVAEKSSEIREKKYLTELLYLSLLVDFASLKNLLRKSLTNISEEALKKTTQQINTLANVLKKDAESWLHQGLAYVETTKDNLCPFCQQDLIKAEVTIKAYQQYFNEEYKKLKEDIFKQLEKINAFNIEQSLNKIKEDVLTNNALIEFWRRFLTSVEFPELRDLDQYNGQIVELFKNIKLLIEKKSRSILEPLYTSNMDILLKLVKTLNEYISSYNSKVKICNYEIKKLKEQQPDIERLKDELEKFEIQKKRHFKETEDLCNKYIQCKNDIENLKKSVDENTKKLKETIAQKVEKYGEETNRILGKFGVPFKIVKTNPKYRGRGEEPYFEYFLEMEGVEVNPLQKAKFTLSGGDRNALALAFFLAKIDLNGDVRDKILIFDDPVSSLDRNRRKATVEKIRDLSEKVNQIIVFTHYETFAYELYESLKKIRANPKTLEIKNRQIKEWNIEEEIKLPYFKKLDKLEKFWGNEEDISETEARKLIREVLEDRLKLGYYKYLKDLGDRCILGPIIDKFRKIIREKEKKLKMFKHEDDDEVIKELSDMEDFSSEEHHGTIDKMREKVSPKEIKNYVSRTLKLIYEWL